MYSGRRRSIVGYGVMIFIMFSPVSGEIGALDGPLTPGWITGITGATNILQ